MIKALAYVSLLLVPPSLSQGDVPISPCPNVFQYETPGTEPGRWYGNINLSTDSTLHSLWLNIVLDRKADILGNWIGDVTTTDNTDFKIENPKMMIHPGPAISVRFFVQYNALNPPTPKLKTIRLNGREICNADNPLPAVGRPEPPTPTQVPKRPSSRPSGRPDNPAQQDPQNSLPIGCDWRMILKYLQNPETGRVDINRCLQVDQGSNTIQPEVTPTQSPRRHSQSADSQNSFGNKAPTIPPTGSRATQRRPAFPQSSESDDNDNNSQGVPFGGGLPIFEFPASNEDSRNQQQCGRVLRQNPNPLVVGGTPTYEGEWPWQVALYQTQIVDNKYICGGTLVTQSHIITAAHCVTLKGTNRISNSNTLTIYLGKHNLRTSVDGVQIRLVSKVIKHPDYSGSTFQQDIAILELREPVTFTEWVQPACLWPENDVSLQAIVGKRGSVVGWGFDDGGRATEELSLVQMPVVATETCIRSFSEFFARFTSNYTFCAGYRNGTSVCNGDSGGGMVFQINDAWYLRGVVSLSVAKKNEYRCDPSHYVVFTDVAQFLPWIKQVVGS